MHGILTFFNYPFVVVFSELYGTLQLEETDYKELDATMIRLPPPIPPSDRLMAAVEAFYAPPSHDRPRNP